MGLGRDGPCLSGGLLLVCILMFLEDARSGKVQGARTCPCCQSQWPQWAGLGPPEPEGCSTVAPQADIVGPPELESDTECAV